MKKLAIVIASVIIFTVAWSAAQSQAELNRKYAEINTLAEPKQKDEPKTQPEKRIEKPSKAAEPEKASEPVATPKAAQTAPKQPVSTGNLCGPQDPGLVLQILLDNGVPKSSAIQLLGSWKSESGLDPCQKRGDGGVAWGLNSWHPARRHDMPENLHAQVKWAVHTEMKRDCSSCYATIMAGGDAWTIRSAIQKSTRWGVLGNRWTYADQFSNMF